MLNSLIGKKSKKEIKSLTMEKALGPDMPSYPARGAKWPCRQKNSKEISMS